MKKFFNHINTLIKKIGTAIGFFICDYIFMMKDNSTPEDHTLERIRIEKNDHLFWNHFIVIEDFENGVLHLQAVMGAVSPRSISNCVDIIPRADQALHLICERESDGKGGIIIILHGNWKQFIYLLRTLRNGTLERIGPFFVKEGADQELIAEMFKQ
ncbi:hypothetical protein KKH43_03985 [Patescibacteria group bacterium]|nr:hypothetical protein [Patescibacteria group bacterium]